MNGTGEQLTDMTKGGLGEADSEGTTNGIKYP